ncbi:MAG TPA: ABC transporter ATP-binding protein [Polyangia bacterium]|jgi:ABC-type Fe3+/spermidine/putrescine transport system ATPase subunit|nr:ABC transporter ATP-binding protein [Polyangia bacterium]
MNRDALRLEALRYAYGPGRGAAVAGVDLGIAEGAFFCLLGPSGCGKTTLLRLIGGYLEPDAGRILLGGEEVTRRPPEARGLGMVFQSYALFPHLSAVANVAFGLEMRGVPRVERERRAAALLDRVGLSPDEQRRRPRELSGGQQQRVALARALVIEPRLLLLDEPFANLDRRLRERLRGELKELQRRAGVATLLVTHDQEEALALADEVGVMLGGRLLQVGRPEDLYERPRLPWIARFLGEANLFEVERREGAALRLRGGLLLQDIAETELVGVEAGAWLLLRPERCRVGTAAHDCASRWAGRIVNMAFLGADRLLDVEVAEGVRLRVRARPGALPGATVGERIEVGIPAAELWRFPEPDPPWIDVPPENGARDAMGGTS